MYYKVFMLLKEAYFWYKMVKYMLPTLMFAKPSVRWIEIEIEMVEMLVEIVVEATLLK